MSLEPTPTLSYSTPTPGKPIDPRWLHAANVLAFLPMIGGTLILLLFLIAPSSRTVDLGTWNIMAGLVCVSIGGIIVLGVLITACLRSIARECARRIIRSTALLLANFPLCGLYIFLAMMRTGPNGVFD